MDFNHVPADVRWAIANWPEDAERVAVTRFCERHGFSRSVFYKIRTRALELGPFGATEPASRRPHRSPTRTDPAVIEHALAVRAWLVEQGLDAGPLSVAARMRRQGLSAPSRATLARAFAAAGVSKPEPRKRPRAANRRFVYPAPNCCWQIDAFAWSLAGVPPPASLHLQDRPVSIAQHHACAQRPRTHSRQRPSSGGAGRAQRRRLKVPTTARVGRGRVKSANSGQAGPCPARRRQTLATGVRRGRRSERTESH
jgi:hypothetical protein